MTAGIRIRPWEHGDAEALHRLVRASHAELSAWLPWCHPAYGEADARAWIAHSLDAWTRRSAFPFAVVDAASDALRGGVGLSHLDHERKRANLGYWTGTPHTGGGLATRAAREAAHFGFGQLGLQRIEIVALPANAASLAVASRLGAVREGLTRNGSVHGDSVLDAWLHSLIPGDLA